ncbi:oligosaccharide flippase family protein [Mycoplasmatota bacterium]|nr:oligosaccharide flippase family protein [Mycoplasmatota bacterium]
MIVLSKTKELCTLKGSCQLFSLLKKHKGILYVFSANFISLLIGAVLSLLIPCLLNIENYGYYKQFTLYLSYVGLLHFGFNDGIYLEYGGFDYKDLKKSQFRMYFRYLFYQQLLVAIFLFILIYFLFNNQNRFFIFSFVSINMVLLNLAKYFSYISQITKRFVLYSMAYLVEKTALIIPILFLYFIKIKLFQYVILSQTIINIFLILLFIITYKDIVFGDKENQNRKEIKRILSLGITLTLGNFIIIMIFNIDRFMIDLLLPIKDFSVYSLAVQFLSIILVFVTSVSMLLYPYLKRKDVGNYKMYYQNLSKLTSLFSILALSLYFPVHYIITNYLPQFKGSITIFLILLPGVILRGEIDIVFNNLFKSLKKQKVFFTIAIIVLLIAIVLNILFFNIFHSLYAFSYATLLTFVFWYIISDIYLMIYFKIRNFKKYVMIIISYSIYFFSANFHNILQGFMLYLLLIFILIFLSFLKDIIKFSHA